MTPVPRWLAGDVRISLLNASRANAYELRRTVPTDVTSYDVLPGLYLRSGRVLFGLRRYRGLAQYRYGRPVFRGLVPRPRGGTLGRSGDLRVTRETRVRLSLSNSLSTRARRPCRPTNQQSRYGGHRARAASKDATSARVLIVRQVVLINDVIDETGALGDTPEIGHEERVVEVTERFVMEALGVECG